MARPRSTIEISGRPQKKPTAATPAGSRAAAGSAHRIASERIASDIEAFCAAGGRIDVLAITRPLDATDHAPDADSHEPPVAARKRDERAGS
jgi:hypothetical protein